MPNDWQPRALYVFAAALLVAGSYFVHEGKDGTWMMFVAALLFVLFANLNSVAEFSATALGIKAKMRDVDARLSDMKRLIEVFSQAQLSAIQRLGRFPGNHDKSDRKLFESIISTMREAGIAEATVEGIAQDNWHKYVEHDYTHAILGGSTVPIPIKQDELQAEWQSLRSFGRKLRPEELEAFVDKLGDDNPARRHLLKCYAHYLTHKQHLDFNAFEKRNEIPALDRSKFDTQSD